MARTSREHAPLGCAALSRHQDQSGVGRCPSTPLPHRPGGTRHGLVHERRRTDRARPGVHGGRLRPADLLPRVDDPGSVGARRGGRGDVRRAAPSDVAVPDYPWIRHDMGRFMEGPVQARRSWPGSAVVDELAAALTERQAAYADPALTVDSTLATPLGEMTLGDLVTLRIMDVWVHEQDVREALGRPGGLESGGASVFVQAMLDRVPRLWAPLLAADQGLLLRRGADERRGGVRAARPARGRRNRPSPVRRPRSVAGHPDHDHRDHPAAHPSRRRPRRPRGPGRRVGDHRRRRRARHAGTGGAGLRPVTAASGAPTGPERVAGWRGGKHTAYGRRHV